MAWQMLTQCGLGGGIGQWGVSYLRVQVNIYHVWIGSVSTSICSHACRVYRRGRGGRQKAEDPRLNRSIDPIKARRILNNRQVEYCGLYLSLSWQRRQPQRHCGTRLLMR